MWIFSEDPGYPKKLRELGINFEVYKGVRLGTHIPAYRIDDDTPPEKIEQLKLKERNKN